MDVNVLKDNVVYEDVDPSEDHIKFFWEIVTESDNAWRSKFLQFVWARTRLPASGNSERFFPNILRVANAF